MLKNTTLPTPNCRFMPIPTRSYSPVNTALRVRPAVLRLASKPSPRVRTHTSATASSYRTVEYPKRDRLLLRRKAIPSRFTKLYSTKEREVMGTDSSGVNTSPSEEVLSIWKSANAVCFDVDSTVCSDEGIDELAAYLGAGEMVAAWTAKAMGGNVPFQDALAARLELMNPSRQAVDAFLVANPPKLSNGIAALVSVLQANKKEVYLVSGGFRQMIGPVADLLNIPRGNIYANNILFNESDGTYAGFDTEEFTSKSGGKANAIRHLKAKYAHQSMVMVGDGATDLEARTDGGADIFIGYGGVQVRDKVAQGADWFVYSFNPLIEALT